jgi:hypothetical protein
MMAQQAAKTVDHPDVKAMQARREERAKVNTAAMKRMDESKPTPTQEENDMARLGVLVEKADDGSGPTVITNVYVANVPLDTSGNEPVAAPKKKKEW